MSILDHHRDTLTRIDEQDRLRRLIPRTGADFASNDYLGLADSPALRGAVAEALARGVPVGAGGSRLLRGNHDEHIALEQAAAAFFGSESALFLSSGFAANSTIFATLPDRHDLIVHDALIHASVHDGMRLSFARKVAAAHNDPQAIEDCIVRWREGGGKGRAWIAVESLYSMDGDLAPIDALAAVAARHDAFLVVDEAHAAGVFGPDGQGVAARYGGQDNVIRLITCGKALGCEGALVLAPKIITDMLVNRGRGFIFSTAPSPLMAAAARAAIAIIASEPKRRTALHALVAHAGALLEPCGVTRTGSQIMPLVIGDDGETMRIAQALQQSGFDVRGIRPPTVPPGFARLRISITLNASELDIAALAHALKAIRS